VEEGVEVNLQATAQSFDVHASISPGIMGTVVDRYWYAVYTAPQHEKSALKHLGLREIESFLPTYETVRNWKNRQRVKLALPLFPAYLFVYINSYERAKVLQTPGVLRIVGNRRESVPLPASEVEFLRSGVCSDRIEPYRDLIIGEKVRVRNGVMQGLCGTLVRKSNSLRFVLTLELINQHAAVQIDAEDLEPITV